MSSIVRIQGTTNTSANSTLKNLSNVSIANAFRNLGSWFQQIGQGGANFNGKVLTGVVQATGAVTFSGAPTAAETLSIANVTFTARASGASGNEFNIGGTTTITATNLAAAINASANLSGKVTATSALGVVTLTSVVGGLVGNGLELSESMTNTTVTAFSGGSDGSSVTLNKG